MEIPWQALIAAAGALATAIGAGVKWIFDRFDKLQKDHREALAAIQQEYLTAEAARDAREDERRKAHIADLKTSEQQNRELLREMKDAIYQLRKVQSVRPQSEERRA